jgi:hypothetical protein
MLCREFLTVYMLVFCMRCRKYLMVCTLCRVFYAMWRISYAWYAMQRISRISSGLYWANCLGFTEDANCLFHVKVLFQQSVHMQYIGFLMICMSINLCFICSKTMCVWTIWGILSKPKFDGKLKFLTVNVLCRRFLTDFMQWLC